MKQIREEFLKFFEKKNHKIIDSSPLLVQNDLSLMFNNSGMAPLKKCFLNLEKPIYKNLTNSQHCLRVGGKHNDLADVGYTKRHHTFFEMLGNFSFGGYFKEEVISYAFEFLTKIIKLDIDRLYVTVYTHDFEAYEIWLKYMDASRIIKLDENIWRMGEVGPFGYCSEIFYDQLVGAGDFIEGDRYLEIWNLVFMQYYFDGKNQSNLNQACIDAGMGLERLVSVVEDKNDTYDISFFQENLCYLNAKKHSVDTKIFLDHLRSSSFMINELVLPGANGAEFVVRRIVRRMLKSFYNLSLNNFDAIVLNILNNFQKSYSTVLQKDFIVNILLQEKTQFEKVLNNGTSQFNFYIQENKNSDYDLNAENLFALHDTFGFNIDISLDLIKQNKYKADVEGFEVLMQSYKEKNKKQTNVQLNYPATVFVDKNDVEVKVLDVYENYIVLDKSPFYAEGGGQIGDIGVIKNKSFELKIINTIKSNSVFLHEFEVVFGEIPKNFDNLICFASFDTKHRRNTSVNHSATHALHHVLRNMLKKTKQMGSYVGATKLRYDFECAQELDVEEVERQVNRFISQEYILEKLEMKYDDAIKMGASAYFKYDDIVKVVKFGPSIELCGGMHVSNIGLVKCFKIIKISNIKLGIKRIEAIAGEQCLEYFEQKIRLLNKILNQLNISKTEVSEDEILKKIDQKSNSKSAKIQEKTIKTYKIKDYNCALVVCDKQIEIENIMQQNNFDLLLEYCVSDDNVKVRMKINEKMQQKYDARNLIKPICELIESKGCGGRVDFVQTGGKNLNQNKIINQLGEILII